MKESQKSNAGGLDVDQREGGMDAERLSKKIKKILFVCTGNICRSPLAHAVLRHRLEEEGLHRHYELESAGTHGYHVGENADARMIRTAHKNGVRLDHPARKFSPADLDHFDLILAMDSGHFRFLRSHCVSEEQRVKVRMFRDFEPAGPKGGDVPDPYYGGPEEFDEVFSLVSRCTETLVGYLEQKSR